MDEIEQFNKEKKNNIEKLSSNEYKKLGIDFINKTADLQYSYNFTWLGRPIIQYPQDIVAMQELIWDVKPDLIIETGIAHGGSLIFSASMLALLEGCGEIENGQVLAVDIDIREHNKKKIEEHPLYKKITMLEGSSIDGEIIKKIKEFSKNFKKILVCLDSNHSHEHVLQELEAYSSLVSIGSYCVVFDTVIEDMPKGSFSNRPWDIGNSPKTAVHQFLEKSDQFEIDRMVEDKLLITVAPDGFLKRVK